MLPIEKVATFEERLKEYPETDRITWKRHDVARGDTLNSIARAYGTTVDVLKSANKIKGNSLRTGQGLLIPVARNDQGEYALSAEQRLAKTQNTPRGGGKVQYVVQSGDSLWGIARKHNVSPASLAQWNGMAPRDALKAGATLVVWKQDGSDAAVESSRSMNAFVHPLQESTRQRVGYTVRRGDTLSRISQRFRVSVDNLKRWNNLGKKKLRTGQKLTLYVDVTAQWGRIKTSFAFWSRPRRSTCWRFCSARRSSASAWSRSCTRPTGAWAPPASRTRSCGACHITTFVFWVGIGHAGTLISAILFLFRSQWRTAVYRATEAMTVFAVMTAGLFPIIHIGRQWVFYWLLPYPNQRYLWPNFKSPLLWDVFAISTYLTVSTTFLVVGLVPDIAAVRDQVSGWRKKLYAACSLGWTGSDNQWRHYTRGYLYLAALATPLVLSVHSVVSWDFAMSIIPGWHGTIFAPAVW